VVQTLRVYPAADLAYWSAAIAAAVILVRIAWVFPNTYTPRMLSRKIREREGLPNMGAVFVVAFTGLRGVVSLAAAQALPASVNGSPFPHRDLILFLTFIVILATLGGQGLMLRPIIRWLNLPCDRSVNEEHLTARIHAAEQALARLSELEREDPAHADVMTRVRGYFNDRLTALRAEYDGTMSPEQKGSPEDFNTITEQRIWWELARVERDAVLRLRRERRIGDEAMRRIEEDIDLLEARIVPQA
ncbi:MAG TPA: cation:proton antiporter, partial [Bryobacteraceae bacterium]|nr:cation:proton antiporter [Bryobacteraceae bacterium]